MRTDTHTHAHTRMCVCGGGGTRRLGAKATMAGHNTFQIRRRYANCEGCQLMTYKLTLSLIIAQGTRRIGAKATMGRDTTFSKPLSDFTKVLINE